MNNNRVNRAAQVTRLGLRTAFLNLHASVVSAVLRVRAVPQRNGGGARCTGEIPSLPSPRVAVTPPPPSLGSSSSLLSLVPPALSLLTICLGDDAGDSLDRTAPSTLPNSRRLCAVGLGRWGLLHS